METNPFPLKFNIFKNDRKQKDTDPAYFITAFKGDGQGSERVGACWLKEGKNGKYFSCSQAKKIEAQTPTTPSEETPPWPI